MKNGRWLVILYPRAWRQRYGEEFDALLEDMLHSPFDVLDLLAGAIDARLHFAGDQGSNWSIPTMSSPFNKKQLLFVATMIMAAAVLDLSVMALTSLAIFEGLNLAAGSVAAVGAAATIGFISVAARHLHAMQSS